MSCSCCSSALLITAGTDARCAATLCITASTCQQDMHTCGRWHEYSKLMNTASFQSEKLVKCCICNDEVGSSLLRWLEHAPDWSVTGTYMLAEIWALMLLRLLSVEGGAAVRGCCELLCRAIHLLLQGQQLLVNIRQRHTLGLYALRPARAADSAL